MPTETEYRNLVKSELGVDKKDELEHKFDSNWDVWWVMNDSYTVPIQFLRVKIRAIMFLIGQSRRLVDTTLGFDQVKASQVVANLKTILDMTKEELAEADPSVSVPELHSVSSESSLPNSIQESADRIALYGEEYVHHCGKW